MADWRTKRTLEDTVPYGSGRSQQAITATQRIRPLLRVCTDACCVRVHRSALLSVSATLPTHSAPPPSDAGSPLRRSRSALSVE